MHKDLTLLGHVFFWHFLQVYVYDLDDQKITAVGLMMVKLFDGRYKFDIFDRTYPKIPDLYWDFYQQPVFEDKIT